MESGHLKHIPFITLKMKTMTNTELYVVKGKVYEQKKGYSAEIGEDIGYEKGAKMIKAYYDQNQDDVLAHFMGRNMIEAILAQPGVIGIRSFYALNELGLKQLVMVGVDSNGNNILSYTTVGDNGELIKKKGIVADRHRTCPPYCGDGDTSQDLGWFD
ncbi:MAG: hypothetical protein JWQ96_230 [Segetibacter sp.]|nr:hypothetical protein [Segetibacter sp.]